MTEIPQAALRVRQMYIDDHLISEIQAETKLALNRVYYWLDGGGGRLPPLPRRRSFGRGEGKARARRALIGRMMRAAELRMQQIEARLQNAGLDIGEQDKGERALAVLARTVRDLTALDERNRQKSRTEQPDHEPVPRDLDELRRRLSQRLAGLLARDQGRVSADDAG